MVNIQFTKLGDQGPSNMALPNDTTIEEFMEDRDGQAMVNGSRVEDDTVLVDGDNITIAPASKGGSN